MDSSIQIKNNLISRIRETKDINFLKALQTIFDSSEQELFQLNKEQEKSIELSRDEINKGQFMENSKVISESRKWLEKK